MRLYIMLSPMCVRSLATIGCEVKESWVPNNNVGGALRPVSMVQQESPADARVTRDSAVIPRWRLFQDGRQPPSWILSNRKIVIRSADPQNPSLEPNMEWIGCTVCEIFAFKLSCDLETGVRGHSRSSKTAPFDRTHTTLYSSSIVYWCACVIVCECLLFYFCYRSFFDE